MPALYFQSHSSFGRRKVKQSIFRSRSSSSEVCDHRDFRLTSYFHDSGKQGMCSLFRGQNFPRSSIHRTGRSFEQGQYEVPQKQVNVPPPRRPFICDCALPRTVHGPVDF